MQKTEKEESKRPLLCLHSPSGSHQRLTQEGAAMPCWGARERLLFPHGVGGTTISQCIALQSSAVQCNPAHSSLSWVANSSNSSNGPGAYTPAHQQRRAQSNLAFLLSEPAKKRWERKERGREQRAALTGGWLMVGLWEALQSFSSWLLFFLCSPRQWRQKYWLPLRCSPACRFLHTHLWSFTFSLEEFSPSFTRIQGMHIIRHLARVLIIFFPWNDMHASLMGRGTPLVFVFG